jgi:hypothetical protein
VTARRYLQPSLFGTLPEAEGPVEHTPLRREVETARERYGDARRYGGVAMNPIYDQARASAINWSGGEVDLERGRFIPTEHIVSSQSRIWPGAVDRLVAESTGLDTPNVRVREGSGEHSGVYALKDGNHRVLAAQRRGQLLIPADVYRPR